MSDIDNKNEDTVENNIIENKVEEKSEEKAKEKVKEKIIDKTDEKTLKTEKNTEEKAVENTEKKVEKNTEDKSSKPTLAHIGAVSVSTLKIVVPALVCVLVIILVVVLARKQTVEEPETMSEVVEETTQTETDVVTVKDKVMETNAYEAVNTLMATYYQSLADGDIATAVSYKDYTDDMGNLTLEAESQFIESFNDITCYTIADDAEGSYYTLVTYMLKFNDIDTLVPGLESWYLYTNAAGTLVIDGDMEASVLDEMDEIMSREDAQDITNKISAEYVDVLGSDETLSAFVDDFANQIRTYVGVKLAEQEATEEASSEAASETQVEDTSETQTDDTQDTETTVMAVVEQVRATDTVNVRASDSEKADKLGKVQKGETLTRLETLDNGWSKVTYEDQEAYIKSEYLEVISSEVTEAAIGSVKATTNVNVRNAASQEADRIGTAQEGTQYNLIEDLGEWLKIEYNGQEGYVKAEYFE